MAHAPVSENRVKAIILRSAYRRGVTDMRRIAAEHVCGHCANGSDIQFESNSSGNQLFHWVGKGQKEWCFAADIWLAKAPEPPERFIGQEETESEPKHISRDP